MNARQLREGKVWVRAACIDYGARSPYHWTEACVQEGPTLVEVDRDWADEAEHLRPCKLCEAGGKGPDRHRAARETVARWRAAEGQQ